MNDCVMRNYCAGRKRYLYADAAMSEIDDRRLHVSNERSGADRKGTIPVGSMLQSCGAGVPNVGDMDLSCLFHGVACTPGGKQCILGHGFLIDAGILRSRNMKESKNCVGAPCKHTSLRRAL